MKMNNEAIEKLEIEKRDLLLVKAILLEDLYSASDCKNTFHQLGETVFNIFIIERKINNLTENIIQS